MLVLKEMLEQTPVLKVMLVEKRWTWVVDYNKNKV
jgi:hypothetical protein